MLMVNSKDLLDLLQSEASKVKNISNSDLLMATFACQHLKDHHHFHSGISTAALASGGVLSVIASGPVVIGLSLTVAIVGSIHLCTSVSNSRKLSKLCELFTGELISRYNDPLIAYTEIRNQILRVETEDIIEYFSRAKKDK